MNEVRGMNACDYKLKPSRPFGWVARCRCGRYVTASYSKEHARAWIEAHVHAEQVRDAG